MKSTQLYLLESIVLLLSAILFLFLFTFYIPQPLLPKAQYESRLCTIHTGMGVREIGSVLKAQGVISGIPQFVLAAKVWGIEGDLQAGRYSFPERNSLASVLKQLTRGEIEYERVTIPEGLIAHEIASILQAEAAIDSQSFVQLTRDTSFIRTLHIDSDALEGYLFPSTYMIYWEMNPKEVIQKMVDAFHMIFNEEFQARTSELGFSVQEVVTLASIIEREVGVPEERSIISAVFHNRMRLGRALESCATVEYALGLHKSRLTDEDLQVQSPYNTYLYTGLPPGPICNPGQASIEAALYPADVDYLYFVSKGNGRHIFSRSLEEHVRAKWRVKRGNTSSQEHP